MAADTKRREPGCECHLEEGDSPCIVHGLYEADTVAADVPGRGADGRDEIARGFGFVDHAQMLMIMARHGLHVVTAAEKAVLDACAALDLSDVKLDEDGLTACEVEAIVDAELSKRGLVWNR